MLVFQLVSPIRKHMHKYTHSSARVVPRKALLSTFLISHWTHLLCLCAHLSKTEMEKQQQLLDKKE